MLVFACLHTSLPILILMYTILGNSSSILAQLKSYPVLHCQDHRDLSLFWFPTRVSYLAQTLTPRCTLVCVCCFFALVAIAWVPSTLASWMWLNEHLSLRCSCLALLVLLCAHALHAIASAASWNPFSNIPLPWLLPYPIVLAPLHISYSYSQKEKTCRDQVVISVQGAHTGQSSQPTPSKTTLALHSFCPYPN